MSNVQYYELLHEPLLLPVNLEEGINRRDEKVNEKVLSCHDYITRTHAGII